MPRHLHLKLKLTHRVGSIDSLAPARSPCGLRRCRAAPAGSIPAGDIIECGMRNAETGKIISCAVAAVSDLRYRGSEKYIAGREKGRNLAA